MSSGALLTCLPLSFASVPDTCFIRLAVLGTMNPTSTFRGLLCDSGSFDFDGSFKESLVF